MLNQTKSDESEQIIAVLMDAIKHVEGLCAECDRSGMTEIPTRFVREVISPALAKAKALRD